ncbi:hypothetical protein Dsin_032951 [Dipteronia sinensis]|uniref:DUF4283 domain-containing protein n=1 Tax=Dipteronia sinensis TaxID=43782 RepID=A0AAE0DJU1_9ROSI|nr:hypothetical protein Dsin_032951 [Dipteronia sinensis]
MAWWYTAGLLERRWPLLDGIVEDLLYQGNMDFTSVSNVNNRLRTRGLSFSSIYLGDKSILWKFGSEFERDYFVNSRFLWDDRFDSIRKWADTLNPQARLVWIECVGVPTRFWNKVFFNKVGRHVGEVVMVEEGTLFKKRLDRGWILVLIPRNHLCPDLIKVKVGSECFSVKTSELSLSVDFS